MIPVFDPFVVGNGFYLSFSIIPVILLLLFIGFFVIISFSSKKISPLGVKFKSGDLFNINDEPAKKSSIDKLSSSYDTLYSTLLFVSIALIYITIALCMFQTSHIFNTLISNQHPESWESKAFYISMALAPALYEVCFLILFLKLKDRSLYYKEILSYVEYHDINDDFIKHLSSDEVALEYVSKVVTSGRKLTRYEFNYINDRILDIKSKSITNLILSTKPICL